MEEFYAVLYEKIKEQVNPTVYIVWFSDIIFNLKNGILEVKSPNQFKSKVVENEFAGLLKQIITEIVSENIELKFTY